MSAASSGPVERWAANPYRVPLGDGDPVAVLGQAPERFRAVAAGMGAEQFARSYAPGKWTAAQLFLHLAQTELAFGVRLRMALTAVPYVVQPFDQDAWMRREPAMEGREALKAYAALRQFNLPLYRGLTAQDLATEFVHPERGPMRVGWILELLAGHDLHHLAHVEAIAGT